MSKIMVFGSINMDLVIKTARAPQGGETLFGEAFQTIPGGKGANQAVAAARLGGDVGMIGKVGADAFGNELKAKLEINHINTKFVGEAAGVSTGIALIVVEQSGENRILVVPGANGEVTINDVNNAREGLESAKTLVAQLENPLASVKSAIELAYQLGKKVIFNPAPAPVEPLAEELLKKVDVLIVNESEAAAISGKEINSFEGCVEICRNLQKTTGHIVFLTMGAKGAIAAGPGEIWTVPAFKINAVDTTAAGDAFIGAVAVLLGEMPLQELTLWANGAGALAASKFGAQISLPDWAELESFVKQNKDLIQSKCC